MKDNKIEAIKLRKQGLSYREIGSELNISKSTLSYWLADIKLADKAQERINFRTHKASIDALIKRNHEQTGLAKVRANQIRKEAKKEFKSLLNNPLFLVGISLYWAEGYKKGATGSDWKNVDFANSDPKMVKVIIKFFKKFLKVKAEKLKVQIIAHNNVNLVSGVEFWSQVTGIKKENFIKTCYSVNKNSKGKRDRNSLPHGTVHIRINDVKLFFKIIGWIDGLKEYLKV